MNSIKLKVKFVIPTKVISLDAAAFTESKTADTVVIAALIETILRFVIYSVVSICIVIAIIATIHAKKSGADNIKPFKLVAFSIYVWDFYSDLMFIARLAEYYLNNQDANIVLGLFISSIIFVVIPYLLNIYQIITIQSKWRNDKVIHDAIYEWLFRRNGILISGVIWTGSAFAMIELCNV